MNIKFKTMKSLKNTTLILFLIVTFEIQSQVKVNFNIGTRPTWGPAITNEEYYYLPDIDTYYDIRNSQYIYLNNGRWVRINNLPRRYRNYNLNTGQVIVLKDYHGRNPYVNYKNHKIKYIRSNNYYYHKGKHRGRGKN